MGLAKLTYSVLSDFATGGIAQLRKIILPDGSIAILRELQSSKLFNLKVRRRFLAGTRYRYVLSPHPNLVNSFEFGGKWTKPYEIIEFVNGVSLASLMHQNAFSLKSNLYSVLLQMAKGLAVVHEHAIMHLDVKPENFIVVRTNNVCSVKLTDFDLARDAEDCGPHRQMGTPAYMAPEQFVSKCSYQASDVFAFGLIAYKLLTGKHAFNGSTERSTWSRQASATIKPLPLSEHVPDINPRIEMVVMSCLSKSLRSRYRNMSHVVQALTRVINPEGGNE